MTADSEDLWDLDFDVGTRLARAAIELGKELGKEARNFGRFQRGELRWEELSHFQKTLFLGGDRAAYEELRGQLQRRKRVQGPDGFGWSENDEWGRGCPPRLDYDKY